MPGSEDLSCRTKDAVTIFEIKTVKIKKDLQYLDACLDQYEKCGSEKSLLGCCSNVCKS